jgi:hypothetical protein
MAAAICFSGASEPSSAAICSIGVLAISVLHLSQGCSPRVESVSQLVKARRDR